ncbi:MAG TPA: hypothetical protein VKR83_04275 [Ktedonobacteraceae bacterium]|nr:hypothetical protein [Ktedonobacteraceae bacterium]
MDRFRYELRLLGWRVTLTPVLVALGLSIFALILQVVDTEIKRFFTASLEIILPLVVGLLVTTVTTDDPAVELLLTMPRTYASTIMRRLFITLLWAALITLLFSSVLALFNLWFLPRQISTWAKPSQLLAGQLIWLPTLLWFSAVGFVIAQVTRSRATSIMLLSSIWIFSMFVFGLPLLFPDWLKQSLYLFTSTLSPQVDYWFTNREIILLTALLLIPLGWLLLRSTEGLLKTASED